MNDRELDELSRTAMRRTEEEPNLWPRIRPVPRPSLLSEVFACAFGGSATLAALWFFFAPSPVAASVSEVVAPAEMPSMASAEHRDISQWLAKGE